MRTNNHFKGKFALLSLFLTLSACEEDNKGPSDTGNNTSDVGVIDVIDGGLSDADITDAGLLDGHLSDSDIPDATPDDLGVFDGGTPTDGAVERPLMGLYPEAPLRFFGGTGSMTQLVIRNDGDSPLELSRVTILDANEQPSNVEFSLQGCQSAECALNQTLCSAQTPGCIEHYTTLHLNYLNPDRSATDEGLLVIYSNDLVRPMHRISLSGTDQVCLPPVPVITTQTPSPQVGQNILVDGRSSVAGPNAVISDYFWSFEEWPSGASLPSFLPQGQVLTSFTATVAGNYRVALRVSNSCGATSTAAASLPIEVSSD